jgi:carboxypeptidase C (cathepsin A)
MLHRSSEYVAALLERNVRVLIYVGTYDWICNWVGNERWTLELDWSGKEEFATLPLRDWLVGGKRVGRTRSANGFTFATVDGAGHMVRHAFCSCASSTHIFHPQVPYDKPKESLELINRWLAEEGL